MVGKRLIPLFLAVTIFLLQGADCVSLFFASQQARDCCQKGHCNRKNPDPCCQVSTKVDLTQVQAKDKVQLPVLAALSVFSARTVQVVIAPVDLWSHYRTTFSPSPPGRLGNFLLPLLV